MSQQEVVDTITKSAETINNNLSDKAEKRCWIKSHTRGVPKFGVSCPSGTEKSGAMCYPPCKAGFSGTGPMCWSDCPELFTNTGAFCLKPKPYGRGTGHTSESNCVAKESLAASSGGCEKNLLLWYPKCKASFHNVGCCTCSPDCPAGSTDIGVSCSRSSYGRTVGTWAGCSSDQESSLGFCYNKCKAGYTGIGPVCWSTCPAGYKKCGALCLEKTACTSYLLGLLKPVIAVFEAITEEDVNAGKVVKGTADLGSSLVFKICDA